MSASARARRFWDKLGEWYGARLTDQYGIAPPSDWCEVIDRADNETLKGALTVIRRENVIHPPTLPQLDKAIDSSMPKASSGSKDEYDVRYELIDYAKRHYPHESRREWVVRFFDAPNLVKDLTKNHGAEFVGLRVGHHVITVDEMRTERL